MEVLGLTDPYVLRHIIPFVLRLQLRGERVRYTPAFGWRAPSSVEADIPLVDRIILPSKRKLDSLFDRLFLVQKRHLESSK